MPINAQITSQKFYSQYRNGETWASLPNDSTYYLIGTIGEKIRTEININISWGTDANGSPNDGFIVDGNTVTRQSGDFLADGFNLGDTILLYWGSDTVSSPTYSGVTITYVDSTTMITNTTMSANPLQLSLIWIKGTSDLEGCLFKYGLIENAEATNYDSKIDGNEQAYTVQGIVTSGTADAMTPINNSAVKSWQNGSVTAQFIGTTTNGTVKQYQIIHDFYLLPYYVDGYLTNLQNGTLPTLFSGTNALKYVFEANFRTSVNNPNENKIAALSNISGAVTFFNKALNAAPNNYTISNVQIEEVSSGDPKTAILIDSKTRYNFDLEINSGTFLGSEEIIVGVSYLPDNQDLEALETVEENYLLDTKIQTVGAGAVSSSIIQDLTATNNITSLSIQVDFEYSAAQQAKLDSNKSYAVWVVIGSDTSLFPTNGSNNADDRISLIVDVQNYILETDQIDGITARPNESRFFRQYRNADNEPGKTDFKGWISDNYCWKLNLRMDYSKVMEITEATFKLGAYNETTDNFFELQSQAFPIVGNTNFVPVSSSPTGFVQSIDIQSTRGFNLEPSDQFNAFEFTTRLDANGQPFFIDNIQQYFTKIGFKLNFEEWLALPGADNIFFNSNEPNDGLNKKASNYSLANGYVIAAFLELKAENVSSGSTEYRFYAEGEVYDFHEDDQEKAAYACNGRILSEDGLTNYGTVINKNEDCRVFFRFVPDVYTSGLQYFARISCDDVEGSIFSIRDLSSITGNASGFNEASPISELIPLPGLTGVEITDDSLNGRIDIVCQLDGDKVQVGKCYNLIGRLWEGERLSGDEIDTSQGGDEVELSQGEENNSLQLSQ